MKTRVLLLVLMFWGVGASAQVDSVVACRYGYDKFLMYDKWNLGNTKGELFHTGCEGISSILRDSSYIIVKDSVHYHHLSWGHDSSVVISFNNFHLGDFKTYIEATDYEGKDFMITLYSMWSQNAHMIIRELGLMACASEEAAIHLVDFFLTHW